MMQRKDMKFVDSKFIDFNYEELKQFHTIAELREGLGDGVLDSCFDIRTAKDSYGYERVIVPVYIQMKPVLSSTTSPLIETVRLMALGMDCKIALNRNFMRNRGVLAWNLLTPEEAAENHDVH